MKAKSKEEKPSIKISNPTKMEYQIKHRAVELLLSLKMPDYMVSAK